MNILRFFIIILFLISIEGCEECNDCGPLDNESPSVVVSFVDSTTINKVLENIKEYQDDSTSISGKLNQAIVDLEEEGLSDEYKETLKQNKETLEAEFNAHNDLLLEERQYLEELKSGKTAIDSLFISENPSNFSIRKDTVFRLFLNSHIDSTTFIIVYNSRKDTISFHYDRVITVDDKRIKVKVHNISIGNNSFRDFDKANNINESRAKFYY